MEEIFDLIVIGGGPGGYTAAIAAAQRGLRAAVVERRELGGTCLNRGCIPTKAMLHAAKLLRDIRQGARFGICAPEAQVDFAKLLEYRNGTVRQLVEGVEQLLAANGVVRMRGQGMLLPDGAVQVTEEDGVHVARAKNVLLATGSKPRMLPVPGMDLPGVLDSDGLFALEALPESLTIIGGGAIGVEFAEAFSALGCKVAILEAQPRLLPGMDREISQNLRMILKKRGVELHLGAMLEQISQEGENLTCSFSEQDRRARVSAQYVLCAVGRQPNTDGLFASGAACEMTRGFVNVDAEFRTSRPNVYAIGDLIGGALAHNASAQGMSVAMRLAGQTPSVDLDVVPHCVYTDPEIASVGLSEGDAAARGIPVRAEKFLMASNGKTLIEGEERGFIKIVAGAADGRVLGAQLMCGRATDMIGELTVAIANRMTVEQLLRGMRAHPSFNEGIGEALEQFGCGAIHAMPRRGQK